MGINKYHARKVTAPSGEKFHSQKEYDRWCELRLLERAGRITDLQRQVEFEILPAQYESYERFSKTGKRLKDGVKLVERGVSYFADFVYRQDGEQIVEDCKGYRTDEYKLKRKLMLYFNGIKIKET